MKRNYNILTIIICIIMLLSSYENSFSAAQQNELHKGRYWCFIDNIDYSTKNEKRSILLWVALPPERPGQEVKISNIFPDPTDIIYDKATNNRVAFWKIDNPEKGANLIFRYDIEVTNSPVINKIDSSEFEKGMSYPKEYKRWTISESWIDITPEIANKAKEIVGKEINPLKQANLIFEWVVQNMKYEYPAVEDRGVKKTFACLKGDCGEYSRVFIAMMRSLGVPARSVTANWYKGSGHAWAEIYLLPHGWVPVDTTVAQLVKNGMKGQMSEKKIEEFMVMSGLKTRDYRFLFGNIYPNRLEVFIGDNVQLVSQKTGVKKTFHFLQPGEMAAWPQAIELNGLSPKTVHAGFYMFDEKCMDEKAAREKGLEDMGSQYLSAGMYDKALTALEKAIKNDPEKSSTLFLLGQAYFYTDQYENAIECFKKSIAKDGGSTKPVIDAWCRIFLGMSYDLLKNRDNALKEYSKAIESGINHKGSLDLAKKLLLEPFSK